MTLTRGGAVGTADGLRGYLEALRRLRKVTQAELGGAMGISARAVLDWEQGRTGTISAASALQAIAYLRGAFADLEALVGEQATEEDGRAVALQRAAAALSDGARDQVANVIRLLSDEARSGRLVGEQFFSKAQQLLVLLDGLSPEERDVAGAIFRLIAEDGRNQPHRRTTLVARLFGIDSRS